MREWFSRAIENNPDSLDTYRRRLWYYSKENSDTNERLLTFGRECLDTQNWRGGTPTILIEVHERISLQTPDRQAYFRQPEVWHDCTDVFEGALLNFPNDIHGRSQYAKMAMACGQWLIARRQFQILGDSPDISVFVSKSSYEYLRRKANRLATIQMPH